MKPVVRPLDETELARVRASVSVSIKLDAGYANGDLARLLATLDEVRAKLEVADKMAKGKR